MALISVIQPNPTPRKKSTWDKVVEGITVANSLLGTGIAATKLYNEFQQTGLEEEKIGILKSQAETEKAKTAAELMNKIEPAKPDDPLAFKLNAPAIGITSVDPANQYYKWKPQEFEAKDWIDNVKTGLWRPLDAVQTEKFKAEGRPVSTIRIKGLSDPQNVFLNTDELEKSLLLQREKAAAEIKKTEAETAKLQSESLTAGKTKADELRKEFEGKPEIRTARDVIAIADRADELVKRNTVSDQVALAYGFIRAQGPGVVTEKELDLASRGAFSDELLQKFGWKRLTDGRFMTPEQAKGVADTLKVTATSLLKSIEPQIKTYGRLAQERGFNVDDVVIPLKLRQAELFSELDPSYLLKKKPEDMSQFEKELFQKTYGTKDKNP